MEGTIRCSANYVPLTPISFLKRAAMVYRDRVSVVYGDVKYTWNETLERCTKLASSLSLLGISSGDVVAALAPNVPALYELHFGVPMAGAVFSTLNIWFDSEMVSLLLEQLEPKIMFVDYEYLATVEGAFDILSKKGVKLPRVVLIPEIPSTKTASSLDEELDYDSLISLGNSDFKIKFPKDECDPITISYSSGTTANPKGIVYNHRGAYLNSLSVILINEMPSMPTYLWTVPMFHCNGWCFTWALAAQGGMSICLRNISAKIIFDKIFRHKVTHLGGAPTILNMIVNAPESEQKPLPGKVVAMTAGAPPPPHVVFKMEELGFDVIHAFGQTETYGAATFCTWKPEWNNLSLESRAKMKALQGLNHVALEEVDIKDPITMVSVPNDGKTMGEVMYRGNTIMSGYLKDSIMTNVSFNGGWFHSGDLAVRHPDGYIEFLDRTQDIIESGGNKISTTEIEAVLFSHPSILEAAVVGRSDEVFGESPCAFVKLKNGCNASGDEIIKYCHDNLVDYMVPRTVVFADLPKTATGKTQKYVLRVKAEEMGSVAENGN